METEIEVVCGVERSARGLRWRDRVGAGGDRLAHQIVQSAAVSDLVARLLVARHVSPDSAHAYLNPTLRDLMPDPARLAGMNAAASTIADAVEAGAGVALFGDYDVDGATSSALMARYLINLGLEVTIHIPDRLTEGYGPNIPAIETLAGNGAELLITLDCGATSFEPLARAQELGLTVVVIDHHQMGAQGPDVAALVNPNRPDDVSGQGHLAAVGVTFLVLVAISRELRQRGWFQGRSEPDLMSMLDLVALGTVCDVVPLTGLNRAYVRRGLDVIIKDPVVGISALSQVAGIRGPMEPYHLAFLLGPRVNAGGRIGDAALGVRLLMSEQRVEAERLADQLNELNQQRQTLETDLLEAAEASLIDTLANDPAVLVVVGEDYHPGIVGLIAGRLKERHRRPAFAISLNEDGTGTASGRSVPGVDLGAIVRKGVESGLLLRGGGHTMAAGLALDPGRLDEIREWLDQEIRGALAGQPVSVDLETDGLLTARGASITLLKEIERVGPFGSGSPEPVFVFPGHRLERPRIVGKGHVRATLVSGDGARIDAIAFRAAQQPVGDLILTTSEPIHVAGVLNADRYQGRERVQVQIRDVALERVAVTCNRDDS